MKVWNVTESAIRAAAEQAGLAIHSDWAGSGIVQEGRALRFRLALGTERAADGKMDAEPGERRKPHPLIWQRRSASVFQGERERRVASVCWHGHYAFMRYLFALVPDARIKTAFADYRGADEFEQKARATGYRNIGSMMYPVQMDEACFCADYGNDYLSSIDRAAEEWASGSPIPC